VKACRDLPGYELFQYVDGQGQRQSIDSADVNAYLREISGEDFTAKDFRTWAGTVLAARELALAQPCESATRLKRNVVQAVEHVAKRLGNTRTVSRKCYIHPAVIDASMEGATITLRRNGASKTRALPSTSLSAEEAAVVALIAARLRRKTA
jgi:DNA topoisomerase-1